MPYGYWLRILTAITLQLLALGFALHVILGTWSLYEANRESFRSYQQKSEENEKNSADGIAKACDVLPQISPALRDCLRAAILAYQKKDTSNKELQAQQEMSFWTFITAVVGGGGLIISIGGLFLLFQSLRHTREALSNDRTIGEAQVRAYLSVESPEQHFFGGIEPGKPFTAQLKIKNTGQSPAYDVRYIAALMVEQYPLDDSQGDMLEPDPASKQRGVTIGANAETRIEADLIRLLTADEIKSIRSEGPIRLYAVAIVTYYDVFKRREQKTQYCAYMTAGVEFVNAQNGSRGVRHEWALANVHNEAT